MPKLSRSCLAPSIAVAAALLAAGNASADGPSTQFSVTGAITTPTTYDYASLSALPAITQTVTFSAGGSSQTHIYTGASLWGIVNGAGIVTNPNVKNNILTKYVLATGSGGYRSVFAAGELNPSFGNQPDLAAYAETINGVTAPLTSDGFARVTSPGDVKGGRFVSNLVDLDVRGSGSTQTGTGSGLSTSFSVTGAVTAPASFDLAALQALPQVSETFGGHTYTGVSFWSLLDSAVGIPLKPNVKNDVLGKYVVATGTDGYQALFSLGELDTDFGNQPDLIAFDEDGQGLGADGFARIVAPNDVKAGRWVSNLTNLEVFSAAPIPEPASDALMIGGLCIIAAAAARRGRFAGSTLTV